MKKSKESQHELWDTIQRNTLWSVRRGKGTESLCKEIMAQNSPNLGGDLDIQVQEANRSS